MTKYDNGYDDQNEDGNDNNNAASGSGSDGLIFDPIKTPWSPGGGSRNYGDGAVAKEQYISARCTLYLPYKGPIKDVP